MKFFKSFSTPQYAKAHCEFQKRGKVVIDQRHKSNSVRPQPAGSLGKHFWANAGEEGGGRGGGLENFSYCCENPMTSYHKLIWGTNSKVAVLKLYIR